MKLAGIIYLYEISQARDAHNCKSLRMFRGMVGNIVVATTKWGNPVKDIECRREIQLSKCQLTLNRFDNSAKSAWRIVNQILKNKPNNPPEFLDSLIKRLETKEPKAGGTFKFFGDILDQVRSVLFHR
jgi:hypothetical protein